MLCEKCGKNVATTHIKTNINGVIEVHHLCSECAQQQSYKTPDMLDSLIDSFFGDTLRAQMGSDNRRRCEGCGMCFDDIVETGKVGCDKCYETFLDQLLPSLQRMHGRSRHAGKTPSGAPRVETKQDKISTLKSKLQKAIDAQEFEQAAKLRDEIKEAEKEDDKNE